MLKHRNLVAFFYLLFFVCGSIASAQTSSGNELISTTQGLSQGLINDILQDKDGFIWIATKGGLNRYDGYNFKIFTNDPQDAYSISSNFINSLLEDKKGRIWIGTSDGGVNVYNKKTGRFLRITQASGLSGNRIEAQMAELPDGKILVNPQGGNLSAILLTDNDKPVITTLNLPGGRTAIWITKDEKGFIWINCTDNSIFIISPATLDFELLYDNQRFTNLIEKTGKFVSAKFSQAISTKAIPDIRTGFIDSTGRLKAGVITNEKNGAFVIDHRYRALDALAEL